MYVYLSKLLPPLLMPVSLVSLLLLLAVFSLVRQRSKLAITSILLAMIVLWLAASPLVASSLYRGLESQYPVMKLSEVPAAQCAVVLGGATANAYQPGFGVELGEAFDRVYRSAELYREGKARTIIIAAGNQPWETSGPAEGELIASLLQELGVPPSAMLVDKASRNTRENALNAAPLLSQAQCRQALLITSAAHMPRALASFSVLGITLIPVSTDARVSPSEELSWVYLLPSARALSMTTEALRERLGQLVYSLRGWN